MNNGGNMINRKISMVARALVMGVIAALVFVSVAGTSAAIETVVFQDSFEGGNLGGWNYRENGGAEIVSQYNYYIDNSNTMSNKDGQYAIKLVTENAYGGGQCGIRDYPGAYHEIYKTIDFTDIDLLTFNVMTYDYIDTNRAYVYYAAIDSSDVWSLDDNKNHSNTWVPRTVSIDVSSLNGNHELRLGKRCLANQWGTGGYNIAHWVDNIKGLRIQTDTSVNTSENSPTVTYNSSANRGELVGEWHFDGNPQDSSGNDNHGKIYGAKFVDGIKGQALMLDGVSDYVEIQDSSLFYLQEFTVSFWIKPSIDMVANPNSRGESIPLYHRLGDSTQVCCVNGYDFLWGTKEGYLSFGVAIAPNWRYGAWKPINFYKDKWYNIVGTFANGNKKTYINGELFVEYEIPELKNKPIWYGQQNPIIGRLNDYFKGGYTYYSGLFDELNIYNHALSASEIKANYEADKNPLSPRFTPAQTTAAASPVSSSYILEKANNYKILLDNDINLQDSASLSRGAYYVVSYNNLLPYASGIEVFSSEGKKITTQSETEPVFTSIAWKEASGQVKPSDIQTMKDILQTSKDIDSAVSPVISATGTTISSINSLKNACVSVPLVGKKCAWDAVSAAFPGISTLANQLESLNSELNQWKSAASSVQQHLPNAISSIEQAKSGGDINPQLQSEISQSLSAFGTLQSKTNQMSQKLASISSTLSDAENGLRSAASTPVVGSLISPVANAVGSMRSQVNSLKGKADSFSRNMGEQSAKLTAVTDTANKRNSELISMWSARQSAETKVYATLIGIAILIIVVIIFIRKKTGQVIEAKQEVKIEQKPTKTTKADTDELKAKLEKTKTLLEKLDERFALGEISEEHYNRLTKKYRDEAENCEIQIKNA